MAFVLLEDMGRPAPKRVTAAFGSIRIIRPVWRLVRYTIRSSRYAWRTAVWVLIGDRAVRQPQIVSSPEEQTQPERATQP